MKKSTKCYKNWFNLGYYVPLSISMRYWYGRYFLTHDIHMYRTLPVEPNFEKITHQFSNFCQMYTPGQCAAFILQFGIFCLRYPNYGLFHGQFYAFFALRKPNYGSPSQFWALVRYPEPSHLYLELLPIRVNDLFWLVSSTELTKLEM